MIVNAIRAEDARELLSRFGPEPSVLERRRMAESTNRYEVGVGSRPAYTEAMESCREQLRRIMEEDGVDPASEPAKWDAHASVALHSAISVQPRIAGDRDFWAYVAIVELDEFVRARHGSDDAGVGISVSSVHYGLGERWMCLPLRLWLRGEIGHAPSEDDPYTLVKRGSVDFWMSGVIRHVYSCSRQVARALIRYQYPEPGSFAGSSYAPQRLSPDSLRDLYRRLRHFESTIRTAAFDESAADEFVASVAEGVAGRS